MFSAEKIFIDVNGILSVQREPGMKPKTLVCPFRPGYHYCGEWCPHFGTVQHATEQMPGEKLIHNYFIELTCAGNYAAIEAPEFKRDTDHLEELHDIMKPAFVCKRGN